MRDCDHCGAAQKMCDGYLKNPNNPNSCWYYSSDGTCKNRIFRVAADAAAERQRQAFMVEMENLFLSSRSRISADVLAEVRSESYRAHQEAFPVERLIDSNEDPNGHPLTSIDVDVPDEGE